MILRILVILRYAFFYIFNLYLSDSVLKMLCNAQCPITLTVIIKIQANPDYKGVCHVALAQEGHCRPGEVCLV